MSGYSRRESTDRPALGASGAGRAISIAFAMLNPQATFLLYFFIPCPAWAVAGALIGLDLYSLNQELNTKGQGAGAGRGVAHAAHLGGAVFGIMSAVALRRMSGFRSMF